MEIIGSRPRPATKRRSGFQLKPRADVVRIEDIFTPTKGEHDDNRFSNSGNNRARPPVKKYIRAQSDDGKDVRGKTMKALRVTEKTAGNGIHGKKSIVVSMSSNTSASGVSGSGHRSRLKNFWPSRSGETAKDFSREPQRRFFFRLHVSCGKSILTPQKRETRRKHKAPIELVDQFTRRQSSRTHDERGRECPKQQPMLDWNRDAETTQK